MRRTLLVTSLALGLLSACSQAPISTDAQQVATANDLARRGHASAERNDLEGALKALDEALRLNPDHARAAFDRAMIRYTQGNLQEALADVGHAAQLEPQDTRILGGQCLVRVAARQVESGLDTCGRALALKQGADSNVLTARGQAYLLLQRNQEALSDFEAALRISPNHMRAMYGRGMARKQLGDQAGGQSDIDQALQRLPGAGREFTTTAKS